MNLLRAEYIIIEEIDRNDPIIPEVMVEEFGLDPYRLLRPIFDAIWNA